MNILKVGFAPLSGRIIQKEFIGFDTETYVNKSGVQTFRLASLVFQDGRTLIFTNKRDMIKHIFENKRVYQNKFIVATNLQFDLTTLFFNQREWDDLKLCWSKSNLITATIKFKDSNKHGVITFIDTLNYNRTSVEQLGRIINVPKVEIDKKLFEKKSLTRDEYKLMVDYNINDSKISMLYMYHFQKTLNELGGNIKVTTPSCSLDLFRRRFFNTIFIKESIILKDKSISEFIDNSYYGGRCEDFKRGITENTNYYDVNSLYPFSMCSNNYPHPSSVAWGSLSINEIKCYAGISEVDLYCPHMEIPLIPYRTDEGKIIYPTGYIHGIYTHAMLTEALYEGYEIKKVYKQIIYKNEIPLFKEFVDTLYKIRLDYKNVGNVEEQTVKLLMNSLYGKFGQKPQQLYEIITENKMTIDLMSKKLKSGWEINEANTKEKIYICSKQSTRRPKNSFPIISSYVTSYSQLHMYKFIKKYHPIYMDTDSIITQDTLPLQYVGKELGQFKLEKSGVVEVDSPKCYAFNRKPTLKGIKFNKNDSDEQKYLIFNKFINHDSISQERFIKLKTSLRRKNLEPNQIIQMTKTKKLISNDKRYFNKDGTSEPKYICNSEQQKILQIEILK